MQDVTFTLVSAIFYASSAFFLSRAVMSQFFVYFTKNPSHEAYPAFTRAYVSISQPTILSTYLQLLRVRVHFKSNDI